MECNVSIDNKSLVFPLTGNFFWGNDEVLYDQKESILKKAPWEALGYSVLTVLTQEEHAQLNERMKSIIKNFFRHLSIPYEETTFDLANYHHYVDAHLHQKIIAQTRFLTYKDLAIDMSKVLERISKALGQSVCLENPLLDKEIVILRISRPNTLDINPPHRDGYLDIWKHTLNVWLPLIGCNKDSSLPVIPKSHYWNEKDIRRTENQGASINGLAYHVPGIVETCFGLNMIRPNPQAGEALIFTPFLIHGCAVNWNKDTTRFSLELRLFNESKLK